MMKWWKTFAKRHKGFSMVELICAVAILSIVITGAGSAMVISARSYQRGNTELDLQQQAQITANLLTNLIIDSNGVEEPGTVGSESSLLSVRKIETETVTDEDGNTSQVTVNYRYMVTADGTDADNPKLVYTREKLQVDDTGAVVAVVSSETNTLAEHISAFTIKRVADNNFDFSLKVVSTTGKTFESDYHVTPRNGEGGGFGSGSSTTGTCLVENELILEPNQTYDLNVRITGTSIQGYTIQGLTGNSSSDTTVSNTAQIKVGASETGSGPEAMFNFNVVPNDTSITPINVKVYVRRINDIDVNGMRTNGTVNKSGGYYRVNASLEGTYLERKAGAWYDADYVNPYEIKWSYEFTKMDEFGNPTHPAYTDYVDIIGEGVENDVPYVIFKLKQDMTSGCEFRVTATAQHPEGVKLREDPSEVWSNKSHQRYGKVSDVMASVSDYWTLEYQAWRRNGKLDIGLALDNSYFWPDRLPERAFMGTAELEVKGYSATGTVVDPSRFNFFNTSASGGFINVDPTYGDVNQWNMILNIQRPGDQSPLSYSSPYYWLRNDDNPGNGGVWSDIVRYEVKVEYWVEWGDNTGEHRTLESAYTIEDVKIKYKNSIYSDWNRTNKVYVTTSDSLEQYKIYYTFDKGWEEGTAMYFDNLRHFVGVIHDDGNDYNDVRCDIPVSEQGNDGVADYIIFSLPVEKKQECINKSASDSGIIREIYEYNPLLEVAKNFGIANGGVIPEWAYQGGYLSKEDQDRIKGCAGTVEFHFVASNISGATLKTMYCPTPDEFATLGNVYYVSGMDASGTDIKIKITCSGNNALYQEECGGTSTTINLTWNGIGWTAN